MPVTIAARKDDVKKRRTHKKSRTGCRNCRLRSVKCDENKPNCKKCKSFGFCCNFDPNVPDLQMALGGSAIKTLEPNPPALPITKVTMSLYLNDEELDRLWRFQNRTVLSMGSDRGSIVFQKFSMELAFTHPYAMHVIQAMTSVHDRYLSNSSPRQTPAESYHLSQAAALFNKKLSETLGPYDKDAVWATAAMLGSTTSSLIEAFDPEEAWPLAPPDESDLDWLRMSELKMAVWKVANPLRVDSVFYDHDYIISSPPEVATFQIDNVPLPFLLLFELDSLSTPLNNAYYTAVQTVIPILFIPYSRSNFIKSFGFIRHMQPTFKRLIEHKDSRALLLMAYWYSKLRQGLWWIERRATLECQAICLYLERYHADETILQELLQFPKALCGLGSAPGGLNLSSGSLEEYWGKTAVRYAQDVSKHA